ncbi:MAG: hypothetical protein HKN43_15605 [Rhodothermales bacterium]|nr:hypothetical protein [Rhodothermales bacterium]
MKFTLLLAFLVLTGWSSPMNAQDYTGTYEASGPQGNVSLTLSTAQPGIYQGEMHFASYAYRVEGMVSEQALTGSVSGSDGTMGFAAQMQDGILYFQLFAVNIYGQPDYSSAQTVAFTRSSAEGPELGSRGPEMETVRNVFINRVKLSDEKVAALEKQYRTQIPNGRFWYDARAGAWGVEGGPTVGFIVSGLELPGPLPVDISGSGTQIFINGREIHLQDQQALHQLLGVTYPGRYTLDASGNLSTEQGQFLVNLAAAGQKQKSGGKSGGLVSGAGGTVGVDGSGGALFYTPTVSGYQSWNN